MGAASFNDAFAGATREDYHSIVARERVPSVIIGGEPQGWHYVPLYAAVTEMTYHFNGLSSTDAHTRTGSVNVTDADGVTYTVPLEPIIVDSSSAASSFITKSVKVSCKPISPHLWELTVRVYTASPLF